MASSSASAAGLQGNGLLELKNELYSRCATEDHDTVFRQEDLLAMGVIPDDDVRLLLQITQRLCDEKLLKIVREGTIVCWMYRTMAEAAKYKNLTREQEMVYSLIDESGAEGIWVKNIKNRSGLHDSTARAAIKFLEGKRYIADMKSVEHLNRKMYIKYSQTPSDKATGAPWYTDGELDEEFITIIEACLYKHIFELSYYRPARVAAARKPKKVIKGSTDKANAISKPSAGDLQALRDAALNPKARSENEDERTFKRRKENGDSDRFLHYPPGYQGYPTLNELTFYVENSGLTNTVLSAEEILQLLDVLCFDKKIERVRVSRTEKEAYKAVDRSAPYIEDDPLKGPSNGLTEAPCGRCPVFDLCEEGGPVAPSNCEYFKDWFRD